ncbi:50S ribosomal protein L7/L12 [bacterium]|nr:50S ribosomal protein L7/L12 [bacterium]
MPKAEVKEEEKETKVLEEKVGPGKEKETGVKEKPGEEKSKVSSGKTPRIDEIISTVEKMTVLELSDLVKALEEKFGVVATAPVAATPTAAPGPGGGEEKTEWSVYLTAIGEKKIQVIKEVRAVTSLGLKEAKTLVEEAPKPVREGISSKKEAEEIKAKLEAAGATVELK